MSNTIASPVKVATDILYLSALQYASANAVTTLGAAIISTIDAHSRSLEHSYAARADLNYTLV